MEAQDALELLRHALWVTVKTSAPVMLVAMFIGLLISFLQAITQIQEATLTFVPKILATFLTLIIFGSYMLCSLIDFTHEIADKIVSIS